MLLSGIHLPQGGLGIFGLDNVSEAFCDSVEKVPLLLEKWSLILNWLFPGVEEFKATRTSPPDGNVLGLLPRSFGKALTYILLVSKSNSGRGDVRVLPGSGQEVSDSLEELAKREIEFNKSGDPVETVQFLNTLNQIVIECVKACMTAGFRGPGRTLSLLSQRTPHEEYHSHSTASTPGLTNSQSAGIISLCKTLKT